MAAVEAQLAAKGSVLRQGTLIDPHGPGVVIDGSQTVFINGLQACRMGDTVLEAVGPPNKIAKGEMTVLIGG